VRRRAKQAHKPRIGVAAAKRKPIAPAGRPRIVPGFA